MKILLRALQQISTRLHSCQNVLIPKRWSSTCWTLHPLKSRGLVRLTGEGVKPFLQGLVTNDVRPLGPDCTCCYNMLLNVQGRVLYDLLAYYKDLDDGTPRVLLEHDRRITSDLIKILKRYKIRKKVDISDASDDLQVFAVLPPTNTSSEVCLSLEHSSLDASSVDPRLESFGRRLVANGDEKIVKCVHEGSKVIPSTEEEYHEARYRLGICEGIDDLPPGNCFPLESNLVFLNGVCFQKGCYIGQELTARTYHTGVTRKRLMPLEFESVPVALSPGDNILNESGKSVGKFRNSAGKCGLGLLRLSEIQGMLTIRNSSGQIYNVKTERPSWWPKEECNG